MNLGGAAVAEVDGTFVPGLSAEDSTGIGTAG
jgi:hypothetical protein